MYFEVFDPWSCRNNVWLYAVHDLHNAPQAWQPILTDLWLILNFGCCKGWQIKELDKLACSRLLSLLGEFDFSRNLTSKQTGILQVDRCRVIRPPWNNDEVMARWHCYEGVQSFCLRTSSCPLTGCKLSRKFLMDDTTNLSFHWLSTCQM